MPGLKPNSSKVLKASESIMSIDSLSQTMMDDDDDYYDTDRSDTDSDEEEEGAAEEEEEGEEEEEEEGEEEEGECEGEGSSEECDDEDEEEEEEDVEEEETDEAEVERRERRLSVVTFNKEELVIHYLDLMKKVRRLNRHHIYIQNYLYQLLLRKKLIVDEKHRKPSAVTLRLTNKLRKQKKKQEAKTKANFEVFRTTKVAQNEANVRLTLTPSQKTKKPTKRMMKRMRRQDPDREAPDFLKKIETRAVDIHTKLYQRVFKSKMRNWQDRGSEEQKPEEAFGSAGQAAKAAKRNKKRRKEIPIGHSTVPVPYHRTMVSFDPKHRKKRRPFCRKKDKPKAGPAFNPLKWFVEGRLIGRRVSGRELLKIERQHLLDFAHQAMLEKMREEEEEEEDAAGEKQPVQRSSEIAEKEFAEVIGHIYNLLEHHTVEKKNHEEAMKKKLVEWGVWEKRNLLTFEGLVNLFKRFVNQPYFTIGEKAALKKESQTFGEELHRSHTNLMVVLHRMYKSQITLYLLQRRLKDKTNQGLSKQGLTLEDFDTRLSANKLLLEKLHKKEKELEAQGLKLRRIIEQVVSVRAKREHMGQQVLESRVAHENLLAECHEVLEKVNEVMKRLATLEEINKPFFLQTAVVSRIALLKDFTAKRNVLHQFSPEAQRQALVRSVYQKQRELHTIQIKSRCLNGQLRELEEYKAKELEKKRVKKHQAVLGGNLVTAVGRVIANCAPDADNEEDSNKSPSLSQADFRRHSLQGYEMEVEGPSESQIDLFFYDQMNQE